MESPLQHECKSLPFEEKLDASLPSFYKLAITKLIYCQVVLWGGVGGGGVGGLVPIFSSIFLLLLCKGMVPGQGQAFRISSIHLIGLPNMKARGVICSKCTANIAAQIEEHTQD